MRVISPWTWAYPTTVEALNATGWEWESPCVADSDRAYFDLLSRLWSEGESFCIVEHDIVIHPTALDELAACEHDWCGFPHEYCGEVQYGLGCVKFSADLIARNPDAMIRVGVLYDDRHPKRHWCRLDAWLQGVVLPGAGEVKHRHETVVRHLGSGRAHGCV